ncbi:hypothetical protein GCM10011533_26720 [Streptosporangium jomthongense]|uniref:DUF2970 domain-containing protein n=1 Tax=Marinobacter aromaticivorans TaxID=1494078 RepID=A0ABW2IXI3_9GAMM|nr:DUF2970 domain-containing protein [Marinobacter aromaticivorans]GGE72982.1 hypothetical protein GCM10011533_26720 [Streptosporangium jomthongense]
MASTPEAEKSKNNKPRGPGVLKVMQSVAAGALGVQSNKRQQEDFGSHSPLPYIIGALLFTGVFIGTLVLIVQAVLSGQ